MQTGNQKQWLTSEDCAVLASGMNKKYSPFTGERFFEFQSGGDTGVMEVIATLRNKDGSFFYPVETRIDFKDQGVSEENARAVLVDMIDQYFQEYLLNDGEVYLPIDWADYEMDGLRLQMRGQVRNLVLEKMADDLLA
ncbi:MAG: hypothetical protein RIQ81_357 [Pseudomonadota bacterium]|jgi:hypothetical protein